MTISKFEKVGWYDRTTVHNSVNCRTPLKIFGYAEPGYMILPLGADSYRIEKPWNEMVRQLEADYVWSIKA
jgi:hypothetical protein